MDIILLLHGFGKYSSIHVAYSIGRQFLLTSRVYFMKKIAGESPNKNAFEFGKPCICQVTSLAAHDLRNRVVFEI